LPPRSRQRGIVVVNHSSYLDGLVVSAALSGQHAFVAKNEFESQFVAGRFLRALGALFVERTDPEGGVEDTRKATLAAQAGRDLVFFPEGGFTRAPGLRPFRLGAFVIAVRCSLRSCRWSCAERGRSCAAASGSRAMTAYHC